MVETFPPLRDWWIFIVLKCLQHYRSRTFPERYRVLWRFCSVCCWFGGKPDRQVGSGNWNRARFPRISTKLQTSSCCFILFPALNRSRFFKCYLIVSGVFNGSGGFICLQSALLSFLSRLLNVKTQSGPVRSGSVQSRHWWAPAVIPQYRLIFKSLQVLSPLYLMITSRPIRASAQAAALTPRGGRCRYCSLIQRVGATETNMVASSRHDAEQRKNMLNQRLLAC